MYNLTTTEWPASATESVHKYVKEDTCIVGPVIYASFNYTTDDGTSSNETIATTVILLFQDPKYMVSRCVISIRVLFCNIVYCLLVPHVANCKQTLTP